MYCKWSKRFLDVIFSIFLIILLFPLLLLIALLVLLFLGRPILFTQLRPGLNTKSFKLYKFRTMNATTDTEGSIQNEQQRLTPFGKWLRSTSLDELPELINVVKGEMSLIGPRPLLMEYLPYYSEQENIRHQVRPGITGWAQVNGRNALTWEEKFTLDAWYVRHQSFYLDVKIIFMTFIKIFKKEGINAQEEMTMSRLDEDRKKILSSQHINSN